MTVVVMVVSVGDKWFTGWVVGGHRFKLQELHGIVGVRRIVMARDGPGLRLPSRSGQE